MRRAVAPRTPSDATWSPSANPALQEILDHIARQLAEEYTLLVRETADRDAWHRRTDEEANE